MNLILATVIILLTFVSGGFGEVTGPAKSYEQEVEAIVCQQTEGSWYCRVYTDHYLRLGEQITVICPTSPTNIKNSNTISDLTTHTKCTVNYGLYFNERALHHINPQN